MRKIKKTTAVSTTVNKAPPAHPGSTPRPVEETSDEFSHEKKTWFVLAISAIAGGYIGAFLRPMWTDNVESAQVMAGLVEYPRHNAMHVYHSSVYSLLIQAAALLLRMGISEWEISMLSSGFQAALCCSALGLFALAFSRSAMIALLVPTIFLWISFTQPAWPISYISAFHGHNYPNLFPNHTSIYGVVGMFWLILVFSLFALRKIRTGSVCLGLMPGIHVALAMACYFGATCVGLLMRQWFRPFWKTIAKYWLAGFGVVAVTGLWQMAFYRDVPENISPAETTRVVETFVRLWDDHNRLLREGEWLGFFESEYYTLILSIALLTFLRKQILPQAKVLVFAILSITLAALLYTLAVNFWPDLFPWRIRSMMITRWLNLSSYAFPTMALALIGYVALQRRNIAGLVCLLGIIFLVWSGRITAITAASAGAYGRGIEVSGQYLVLALIFPVTVVAGACLLVPLSQTRWGFSYPQWLQRTTAVLIAALLVGSFGWLHWQCFDVRRAAGLDVHSQLLKVIGQRNGLLLAGDGLWELGRIQLRTRRPVLLDPMQFNMLLKVPTSGPRMAYILQRAYGIRFEDGPRAESDAPIDELWRDFSLAQWQEIRREFKVTDVLIIRTTRLSLPEVASTDQFILYTIPPGNEE